MNPSHALRTPQRPCLARAPALSPLLCALALAGVVGSAAAATNWTDGQAATLVLGADNLTTAGGGGASATRFAGPTDICADAASGKVFVIAFNQNRILRFSAAEAVKNGGAAEAVFGQPDFTSTDANSGGLSAKSLSLPMTCAMDAAGRLFVTDHGNKRVMRYDDAATKPSFAQADGVLGQADFASSTTGTTANSFGSGNLYGIALDAHGNLYVSDGGNNRVLRFDNAASKANGADADGVLGATNFTTTGGGGVTASTFSPAIYGLTVDAAGNLYVSDAGNKRILRFDNAAAKANGAAANGVLGAPDLMTAGNGATASATNMSMNVYGIDVLADGALYAADFNYNRVLVYNDPAHKANGAAADHVLGQVNFTDTTAAVTATGLNLPLGLGYNAHAGYLMIPDYAVARVVGHYAATLKPNAAPTASSVAIAGTPAVGQLLTGSYTYADADNDTEGASTFQWKRGSTVISGATALQYTPVAGDAGQTLTFCVTPVASTGTATGAQACSVPSAPVVLAPLAGACGAAAGQPTALVPATGLCSVGTPGAVASASGQYTWQCQGLHGGSASSCQAPWANAGSASATVALQTGNNWQVSSASFS
ncbi:MAG: NHL repeat-containing protein, partial [Comamonadaceae bacterium]|nr:NHL repeat-containing protein [Comamonadaceae bacterium]